MVLASAQISHAAEPTVIVLSWDGMRFDYPDRDKFPGLRRLEKEGIRAHSLIPVYPSSTFPTHVSMATGVSPGVHGIMDNKFFDRKKGFYAYDNDAEWLDAEPVWIAAERQGIPTATYFWVGSDTDWRNKGVSYRMAPFSDSVKESEKVDQIIAWLDLPEDVRPRLIMSYWAGADHTAHVKGPEHPDVVSQLHTQDEQLTRLLSALDERNLWPSTTLMLVGDHGMSETDEFIDVKALMQDNNLDVISSGRGSVNHLFLKNQQDKSLVLDVLSSVPNIKVYEGAKISEIIHPTHVDRTGDIVITTEAPFVFASQSFLRSMQLKAASLLGWKIGGHGYSPDKSEMHSVFFAMGREVNPDKTLGSVHQLQITPTITNLLGIDAPMKVEQEAIDLN